MQKGEVDEGERGGPRTQRSNETVIHTDNGENGGWCVGATHGKKNNNHLGEPNVPRSRDNVFNNLLATRVSAPSTFPVFVAHLFFFFRKKGCAT